MRDFAERLIVYETRENKSSETKTQAAFLVGEKLRPQLAALMGNVGFRALISRALALSNAEIPWLRAVHVKADGSFEGLDELGAQVGPDEIFEGRVVLLCPVAWTAGGFHRRRFNASFGARGLAETVP